MSDTFLCPAQGLGSTGKQLHVLVVLSAVIC